VSGALTLTTFTVLLFCVATDAAREVCFKAAAVQSGRSSFFASLLTRPVLWLGLLFWAVELVAWLLVLGRVRLAIAFPIMALTYAVTPIAAGLILGETLTRRQAAGAALVALGSLTVSLAELGPSL